MDIGTAYAAAALNTEYVTDAGQWRINFQCANGSIIAITSYMKPEQLEAQLRGILVQFAKQIPENVLAVIRAKP